LVKLVAELDSNNLIVNIIFTEIKATVRISLMRHNLNFSSFYLVGKYSYFLFQYISNKMQSYTVYLYLETDLHVSGVTSTHHQEHIQLYCSICYLSHRYCYVSLSWKIWNASSKSSTIAAGSSNGVTNTRCCRYSCMRS